MRAQLFAPVGAAWVTPALIVSAVGVSLSALFFVLNARRDRKALAYSVRGRPLVQVGSEARGKVQVLFEGEPVGDPYVIDIELANVGRAPLQASDFERAIRVELPVGARPMWTTLTATGDPPDLEPKVTFESGEGDLFELSPLLLNSGDTVAISVLTSFAADPERVKVTGRIAGVKSLKRSPGIAAALFGSASWPKAAVRVLGPAMFAALAIATFVSAAETLLADPNIQVKLTDGKVICARSANDLANGAVAVVRADDGKRLIYAADEVDIVKRHGC